LGSIQFSSFNNPVLHGFSRLDVQGDTMLTLCNSLSFFLIEGSRYLSTSDEVSRYSIFKERIELSLADDRHLKHEENLKIVNLKVSLQITP